MAANFSTAIDQRRVASALAGQGLGCEVQVHDELVSTNNFARELGNTGYPHGLVIIAESQTAGRGRRENRWQAEMGRDILMSVLLRPAASLPFWPRITTIAALSLCKVIETTTRLNAKIKWPNDVYLGDLKVAGILAETFIGSSGAFMVLGIGLNVNTERFTDELSAVATSLLIESDAKAALDRTGIVITLLKQLALDMDKMEGLFSDVILEVRARSWLLGRQIEARIQSGPVRGIAADLNEEGHLILRGDDGLTRVLTSAEHVRVVS